MGTSKVKLLFLSNGRQRHFQVKKSNNNKRMVFIVNDIIEMDTNNVKVKQVRLIYCAFFEELN